MTQVLSDIVSHVVAAPVLLVACDFDGTLADLVEQPDRAAADPVAIAALDRLNRTRHTHVAIISGRGLEDLRARLGAPAGWELSGSHGAEIAGETAAPLSPDVRDQIERIGARLRALAAAHPGCFVEHKPRGVAFHYRALPDDHAGPTVEELSTLSAEFPALTRRLGSMVVEFLADPTTKAHAVRHLRRLTGASAVIFIGDDLTDEHAFSALGPADAPVKVGPGDTRAHFRLGGIRDVARLLVRLADERQAWAAARSLVPITSHSVLSDQRTIALVTPDAAINWFCTPRIDSPPIFAELLGGPASGAFSILPVPEAGAPEQAYDGDSLVLVTRWPGCTVTDYLDCGGGRAFQRAGRTDLVRVIEGSRACRIRFAPRLDFGRVPTRLIARENGLEIDGSPDPILLFSPGVRWRITADGPHHTADAIVDPAHGAVHLELRAGSAHDRPHMLSEAVRRQATHRFWSTWAATLRLPAVAAEQARRSALMLRALIHGPTGAIAAAGTTSLPEHLGGQRNWDYRYCWPRDAAMAAAALVRLGNTGTAMRLLDWLARVLDRCESPGRLRPIYTVDGRDLGPEAEIGGLPGYGGSTPVRIGNAAAQQVQLDVFGPITDLLALLAEQGAPISPDHWRMTRAMVEAVEARWQEPDHGIWEIRAERRHHVHSRAMCFHTVDRALVVHDAVMGRSNAAWADLRERIRADVIEHGFSRVAGAYTAAYGGADLDAAALCVGLTGLVAVDDPRFRATIDAVDAHLCSGGTVFRYRADDGLPGREGGFHLCTGWLIEALARAGRADRARELFGGLLRCVGPTGVLSEQVDPDLDFPLGNTPQAYSHLALINAAIALEQTGHRHEPSRPDPNWSGQRRGEPA